MKRLAIFGFWIIGCVLFSEGWNAGFRYGTSTFGALAFQQEGLTFETSYEEGVFQGGLSLSFSLGESWQTGALRLEGAVCGPFSWYQPVIGIGIYLFGATADTTSAMLPDFIIQYGLYGIIKPLRIKLDQWLEFTVKETGQKWTPVISFGEFRYGPVIPLKMEQPGSVDYSGDFLYIEFSPISISFDINK